MMVEPLFVVGAAEPDLVHQRQPSAGEGDRLAAAAELFGGDRRDRPVDGPRHVVDEPRRVAEIDKAQLVPASAGAALDERHPVLFVPPRPLRLEHAPVDEPVWAGAALVDARQYLLAPAFWCQLAQDSDAPERALPGEEPHVLKAQHQPEGRRLAGRPAAGSRPMR